MLFRKMISDIVEKSNDENLPLKFKVIARCGTSKARVGLMSLRHADVDTPVFMPVGTQV